MSQQSPSRPQNRPRNARLILRITARAKATKSAASDCPPCHKHPCLRIPCRPAQSESVAATYLVRPHRGIGMRVLSLPSTGHPCLAPGYARMVQLCLPAFSRLPHPQPTENLTYGREPSSRLPGRTDLRDTELSVFVQHPSCRATRPCGRAFASGDLTGEGGWGSLWQMEEGPGGRIPQVPLEEEVV